jgi:hypothetical protein
LADREEAEKASSAFEPAETCRLPYRKDVVRQEPAGAVVWPQRFGARAVRLPERPKVPLDLTGGRKAEA